MWKEEEFLSLIDFRRKLAWELINNKYWKMEETALRRSKRAKVARNVHTLETDPLFAKHWMGPLGTQLPKLSKDNPHVPMVVARLQEENLDLLCL